MEPTDRFSTPYEILNSLAREQDFSGCIGAMDGSHIYAYISHTAGGET